MRASSFINREEHKEFCERMLKKGYINFFSTRHRKDMTRVTLRIGAYDMGNGKKGEDLYHVDVWLDIGNDRTFEYEENKPFEWSYDYNTFIKRFDAVLNPSCKKTAQLSLWG